MYRLPANATEFLLLKTAVELAKCRQKRGLLRRFLCSGGGEPAAEGGDIRVAEVEAAVEVEVEMPAQAALPEIYTPE